MQKKLQEAGADAAPVVSVERFLLDRLPCVVKEYPVVGEGRYAVIPLRAGVSLGGPYKGVTPGELGHKSVQQGSICGAPVEEGQ